MRVEAEEERYCGFGDGEEVWDAGEAGPAAAATLEEVEQGAEAAAEEAFLGAEGGVEVCCGEVSCGAGAEQGAESVGGVSDHFLVFVYRVHQDIRASADGSKECQSAEVEI